LCWEDEDPKLPVSIEIEKFIDVFKSDYGFDTEVWRIPGQNSHAKLNQKILNLIDTDNDPKDHLFIVYYGGHARLTHDRLLSWTRCVKQVFTSGLAKIPEASIPVLIPEVLLRYY
jgi:hypothetical protein